mmetsp:Transcript_16891/g.42477  ORF Transcript_16891/g.42477 Transcript_16891/m.42477 type:complete len:223 (+) Transcript_16891:918-1586(+)
MIRARLSSSHHSSTQCESSCALPLREVSSVVSDSAVSCSITSSSCSSASWKTVRSGPSALPCSCRSITTNSSKLSEPFSSVSACWNRARSSVRSACPSPPSFWKVSSERAAPSNSSSSSFPSPLTSIWSKISLARVVLSCPRPSISAIRMRCSSTCCCSRVADLRSACRSCGLPAATNGEPFPSSSVRTSVSTARTRSVSPSAAESSLALASESRCGLGGSP